MIFHRRLVIFALAGMLASCSVFTPKPDWSSFYVLNPQTAKAAPIPPPDPTLVLAVYSIDVPDYLDRPQMVTRLPGNQVALDEYHRWAEPLGLAFARVLAQDIHLYSDSPHVAAFPLPPGFGQEFEVSVQVLQFDGALGGDVTLHAQWRISGPGGKPAYYSHESVFTRPAATGTDSVAGYVDALSALTGGLASEIVTALPEARTAKAAVTDTH
jgi:uncharacterized lipoprotein YmbA